MLSQGKSKPFLLRYTEKSTERTYKINEENIKINWEVYLLPIYLEHDKKHDKIYTEEDVQQIMEKTISKVQIETTI